MILRRVINGKGGHLNQKTVLPGQLLCQPVKERVKLAQIDCEHTAIEAAACVRNLEVLQRKVMEDWRVALVMAQVALQVKNRVIGTMGDEIQALRKENEDMFRAIKRQGSSTLALLPGRHTAPAKPDDACSSGRAAGVAVLTAAPASPSSAPAAQTFMVNPAGQVGQQQRMQPAEASENASAAAAAAAAAEAQESKQEPESAQAQQQGHDGTQVQELQAELAAARQHIAALEAELQDTMDAAMQLWETVQLGNYSEGTASRAGSLYQEQLSLCGAYTADGDEDAPASWRTPSASPAPNPSPRSAAGGGSMLGSSTQGDGLAALAAAGLGSRPLSAAVSPRLPNSRPSSSGGQTPGGFFTPIEMRVNSLTNKLRVLMNRQPGLAEPLQPPAAGDSLPTSESGPAAAAAAAAGAAAPVSVVGKITRAFQNSAAAEGTVVFARDADVRASRDVGDQHPADVEQDR